jgi:hypothetical protein
MPGKFVQAGILFAPELALLVAVVGGYLIFQWWSHFIGVREVWSWLAFLFAVLVSAAVCFYVATDVQDMASRFGPTQHVQASLVLYGDLWRAFVRAVQVIRNGFSAGAVHL